MKHPENMENSIDVAPMLEHYVKEHATKVKEDTKRKLKYEDCCNYCDVHHDNRLSAGKQKQIQAWTSEVNDNMAHINRIPSAKSTTTKEKPKLKFLKYTPLGVPDKEDGFRRIHTPGYIKETTKSYPILQHPENGIRKDTFFHGERSKFGHNETYITQFYDSDGTSTHNAREIKSARSNRSIIKQASNHNGTHSKQNGATENEENHFKSKSTVTFADSNALDSVSSLPPSSYNTPRNTQLGARTTSNNLLNVFSIDDSFRQHRGTLATSSPWMGSKVIQQDRIPLSENVSEFEQNNIGETPRIQFQLSGGQGNQSNSLKRITSPLIRLDKQNGGDSGKDIKVDSFHGCNSNNSPGDYEGTKMSNNKAVTLGFDNLENTNEATNSCAYKGLYKFDKSCGQPLNKSQGSKRFQKLNNNLHKMVEDFHLNGTTLSLKMKKWNAGDSDTTSSMRSRPQSGSTASSFGARHKHKLNKRVKQTIPEDGSNGDDGRESFLEMIMDMDQRKSGGKGQVQMHTYLYV